MNIKVITGFAFFAVGLILYIIWNEDMMSQSWNLRKTIALGCILLGGLLVA